MPMTCLMQAIELVKDRGTKAPAREAANRFLEECKSRKVLVGKGGRYDNTSRIAPPMLIGDAEIDHACDGFDQALGAIAPC